MSPTLGALARDVGLSVPSADVEISGVTDDSRLVTPGALFVAHRGALADGHDFVADALRRGAAAVVSERPTDVAVPTWVVADGRTALAQFAAAFYDHPTRSLYTVGVTGTNGKTSVCHFIAHLLGPAETAVISTVANFDRGLRALTTPASPVVQRFAREAVDAGKRSLVLEASSAGLEQERLGAIAWDAACFTNLTRDHLDLHGTMEAYGAAKARLFRALKPSGWGVVNADDPFSETLGRVATGRLMTYALSHPADLTAEILREDQDGLRVTLRTPHGKAEVAVSVHGRHGAYNALAALGVALAAGRPFAEVVDRLASLPRVSGRWETLVRDDGMAAVVDYAHTPDGLERVLTALRPLYRNVTLVFGCAGGSDRGKRPQMGAIAGRFADLVVVTTDNPKNEDPQEICRAIVGGLEPTGTEFSVVLDRREALALAVERTPPRGVILVAGKGHETYQIVRGAFEPHSDRDALAALGFAPAERGLR
ncbi:MAG: UDP-N-acetylmuramoyl-L-alanyl-D-glutamate--2,6-diaminopimelate ligase [Candidatus Bipolaricaulota bacterium]